MNTEQNDWIPVGDSLPTESDLPVWGINIRHVPVGPFLVLREDYYDRVISAKPQTGFNDWATHWKRATIPPPPPKEQTQAQKDDGAFRKWDESGDGHSWDHKNRQQRLIVWMAALAMRDAQNKEDLQALRWSCLKKRSGLPT